MSKYVKIFKKPPLNRWGRTDVKKQPNAIFVFGDNDQERLTGGQAIIRGLPNAFGIPTKKMPSTSLNAYYTNDDFKRVKAVYDKKFKQLKEFINQGRTIYLPADGLGTGLAQLQKRADKIYEYLESKIEELKNYEKPSVVQTVETEVVEDSPFPKMFEETKDFQRAKALGAQVISQGKSIQYPLDNRFLPSLFQGYKTIDVAPITSFIPLKKGEKGFAQFGGKNVKVTYLDDYTFDEALFNFKGITRLLRQLGILSPTETFTFPSGSQDFARNKTDKEFLLDKFRFFLPDPYFEWAFREWGDQDVERKFKLYKIFQLEVNQKDLVKVPQKKKKVKTVTKQVSATKYPIVLEASLTDVSNCVVFLFISSIATLDNDGVVNDLKRDLGLKDIIDEWIDGTLQDGNMFGDDLRINRVSGDFGKLGSMLCFELQTERGLTKYCLILTNELDSQDDWKVIGRVISSTPPLFYNNIEYVQRTSSITEYPNIILSLENLRGGIGVFEKNDTYNIIASTNKESKDIYVIKQTIRSLIDGLPIIKPKTIDDTIDTESFKFISVADYTVNQSPEVLRDEFEGNLIFVQLFNESQGERIKTKFAPLTIEYDLLELFPFQGNAEIMQQYYSDLSKTNFQDLVSKKLFSRILKDVEVVSYTDEYVLVRFFKSHYENKKYKDNKITEFLSNKSARNNKKLSNLIRKTPLLDSNQDFFSEPTFLLNLDVLDENLDLNVNIEIPNLNKQRESQQGFTEDDISVRLKGFNSDKLVMRLRNFLQNSRSVLKSEKTNIVLNFDIFNFSKIQSESILDKLFPLVQEYPNVSFTIVGMDEITKVQDVKLDVLNTEDFEFIPTEMKSQNLAEPEIIGWIGYIAPYKKIVDTDEGYKKAMQYTKIIVTGDAKIYTPNFLPWTPDKDGKDYPTDLIQSIFNKELKVQIVPKIEKTKYKESVVKTEYLEFDRHNVLLPKISDGQRWFQNKYFFNLTRTNVDLGDYVRTQNGGGTVIEMQGGQVKVERNQKVDNEWTKVTEVYPIDDVIRKNYQRRGLFALYSNGNIKKINPNVNARGKSIVLQNYPCTVYFSINPFDGFYFDLMKEVLDFNSDVKALDWIIKFKPEWINDVKKNIPSVKSSYSGRPDFVVEEIAARVAYFQNSNQDGMANAILRNQKGITRKSERLLESQGVTERVILDKFKQMWEPSKFRRLKMIQYIRNELQQQNKKFLPYDRERRQYQIVGFQINAKGNPLGRDILIFAPTFQFFVQNKQFRKWTLQRQYVKMVKLPIDEFTRRITNEFGLAFGLIWHTKTKELTKDWVKFTMSRFRPRNLNISAEDHNKRIARTRQRKIDERLNKILMSYYGAYYPLRKKAANIFPRFFEYIQRYNLKPKDPEFEFPLGLEDNIQIKKMNWINIDVDRDGDFKVDFRFKPITSKLELFILLGNFINAMSYTLSPESKYVTPAIPTWGGSQKEILVSEKTFNDNYKRLIKSLTVKNYPNNIKRVKSGDSKRAKDSFFYGYEFDDGDTLKYTDEYWAPVTQLIFVFIGYANLIRSDKDEPLSDYMGSENFKPYFEEKFKITKDEVEYLNIEYRFQQNLNLPMLKESIENNPFNILYLINQTVLPQFKETFELALNKELKKTKK